MTSKAREKKLEDPMVRRFYHASKRQPEHELLLDREYYRTLSRIAETEQVMAKLTALDMLLHEASEKHMKGVK